MFTMALVGRAVTEWAGAPDAVVDFGVRFTRPVVVPDDDEGTEIEVSAKVRRGAHRGRPDPARPDRHRAGARRCCRRRGRPSATAPAERARPRAVRAGPVGKVGRLPVHWSAVGQVTPARLVCDAWRWGEIAAQGCSSIGRAAVSKTAGCRFKSCHPCASGLTVPWVAPPSGGVRPVVVASAGWLRGIRGSPSDPPAAARRGTVGPAGVTSAAHAPRRANPTSRDGGRSGREQASRATTTTPQTSDRDDEIVDDAADDDATTRTSRCPGVAPRRGRGHGPSRRTAGRRPVGDRPGGLVRPHRPVLPRGRRRTA